ncbi:MAG TPA: 50S ribosomal protein L10 [Polyangiales bacterium]
MTALASSGGASAPSHNAAKQEEVSQIRDAFEKAATAVLLDFKGVNVSQITDLRTEFRKAGVKYLVVKNTLVKVALKGTAYDNAEFHAQLKGQTGIAWSFEDPSAAAKVVKAFRGANDANAKLNIKCGVVDAKVMPGAEVESVLATMPGKNELRAMLLATLQAPAQNLVRLLQAPAQNLAYLLDAQKRKLEEG